jgi:predicted RNA-binding Zn-ribbon protein involved in translation (DUF1610 family)
MNCPKCKEEVPLDVWKAIDEDGEVYLCPHCGWKFRFALR